MGGQWGGGLIPATLAYTVSFSVVSPENARPRSRASASADRWAGAATWAGMFERKETARLLRRAGRIWRPGRANCFFDLTGDSFRLLMPSGRYGGIQPDNQPGEFNGGNHRPASESRACPSPGNT